MQDHWTQFGRDYYTRLDFEAVPTQNATAILEALSARIPTLAGTRVDGMSISTADIFAYTDPVDGSTSDNQGWRIWFEDDCAALS